MKKKKWLWLIGVFVAVVMIGNVYRKKKKEKADM